MSKIPSPRDIEKLLTSFKRALHPRELASRLEIGPQDYSQLIAVLDAIEQAGGLQVLPGGRVRAVTRRGPVRPQAPKERESETWQGSLSVHQKGFGFVSAGGHDDVFIPPDAIYEALHGDTIQVRITGKSRKGLEGRVEGVVKRRSARVAGVVNLKRKSAWLEPDDSRLRGPIVLSGDFKAAQDGDAAVADIVRFPDFADELPEAEIVEVLGAQGDPQTEVKKILLREEISEEHSAESLRNAEQMATRLGGYRLGHRRDLRHVPLPTIDPDDARDHDDALWVERTKSGYRAYIAIADVSEYVRPESALDEEARDRGCTIYLPDRAIPMLPRALAGDLCSLLPEQDRFCMCVIADIDKSGTPKKFEIVEGLMRSAAKLTYGGVARALGFDPESPQQPLAEAMKEDLRVLQELTEKLRKKRMQRGALNLDLPEARVVLDEGTGAPTEVKKRATRPGLKKAYSLVEEMMLLANELVAEWLAEKNAPAIYRIHGKPDPDKLERLAKVTDTLNVDVDVSSLEEPLGVSNFLNAISKHERKDVLEMLLLRSLKQAVYDINNVGHFGLASERYVHFTSPIRRYPDLRVHRQIKHILRGGKIDVSDLAREDMSAAAGESSRKERAAMEVEREVLNLYRAVYMRQHIGDVFEARVTGISGGGLYLSIDDPCVDVMVVYDALGPDRYEMDENELGVVGERSGDHIMMGDRITVEITDAAILRRTVYAARVLSEEERERFDGGASQGRDGHYSYAPGRGRPRSKTFRGAPGASSYPRSGSDKSEGDARGGARRKSFKPSRQDDETRGARKATRRGEGRGTGKTAATSRPTAKTSITTRSRSTTHSDTEKSRPEKKTSRKPTRKASARKATSRKSTPRRR